MRLLKQREKTKEDPVLLAYRVRVVNEARKRLISKGIEEVCTDRLNEIQTTDQFEEHVKSVVDDTVAYSWC